MSHTCVSANPRRRASLTRCLPETYARKTPDAGTGV